MSHVALIGRIPGEADSVVMDSTPDDQKDCKEGEATRSIGAHDEPAVPFARH